MTDPNAALPIGRRVFLGSSGLGAAGVVFGAKVQNWLEQVMAPIEAKDPTGLTVAAADRRTSASTRSPASFPHRARDQYTLHVNGLVDKPFTLSYARAHGDARRRW